MGCLQMTVIWGEKCEWYGFCPSTDPLSTWICGLYVVEWL
jgi:hypothetical protein